MKPLLKLIILFLFINFGSLALGSFLMNNGPLTEWYTSLNKAPWTPPGWFFGVAWTTIMICFSIYLGHLFIKDKRKKLLAIVFFIQSILNISWNYIFFNQHLVFFGLIVIVILSLIIFYYFFKLSKNVGNYRYLILPYMIWLCIATSLNLYFLIYN
ncbi:tryptophan-rich sensory protein [Polaribacter sp. MSW13]|uniref:Tryptophan-rich sensory protein n=1 Tax=Polaribacter marinus TaxID=2916838 RepID=A0A9X2AHY9_9FLAO|nr:TspO/MBR family protein [Polaribacter marinus]MCI2227577.1 tryptophan-rich sensory protein [Polaribacter marinus]